MKYIRYFVTFVFFFLIFQKDVDASINVYNRTIKNPLVPKDVIVSDSNINDILQTPAVSATEKIYDYANLYTEKEEEKLYNQVNDFINYSNIDVAIVTINNSNNYSLKDYAYNFYDYNDFKMDGIIFVIMVGGDSPEIFMGNSGDETGKVFTIYTDDRINQILKYIYSDIEKSKYYSATNTYVKILQGFFNLDRAGDYRVNEQGKIVKVIPWLEIVILSLALAFIFTMIFIYRFNKYNKVSCQDSLKKRINDSTLAVKLESDNFYDSIISDKK